MPVVPDANWEKKYGNKWSNRYVPPLDDATLAHFAKTDDGFQRACAMANVKPTRRQASKYKRHFGLAWKNRVSK